MSLNSNVIKYKFIKDKKVSSDCTLAFHPQHYYSNCAVAGIMEDEVVIVKIVEHKKNFTITCNEIPQNHGLSLEARGLMSEALSLPKDWELHKQYFVTENNSLFQINKIFKELKEAGHARIKNIFEYDQQGSSRIKDRKWVIYEDKRDNEDFQKDEESLNLSNPLIKGLPHLRDSLNCGITLNDGLDPPIQRTNNINKQSTNNNIKNTHTMVDDEILKVEKKKAEQFGLQLEQFEEFWSHRPGRGKGSNSKARALKWWLRRMKEGEDPAKIIKMMQFYKVCCQQLGTINTRGSLQASSFIGEDEHYKTDWEEKAYAETGKKVKTPEDLQAEKDREEEIERQSEEAYLAKMQEYNKTHPMGVSAL